MASVSANAGDKMKSPRLVLFLPFLAMPQEKRFFVWTLALMVLFYLQVAVATGNQ